jgi:hypothetical protein
MSTGPWNPLNWADASALASQLLERAEVAAGDDTGAQFALLFAGAMGRLTSQNKTPATPVFVPDAVLDKNRLADWMDAHALTRSSHHCAMYCRLGMEAAGLGTQDRPRSGDAGDYGPFLLRHGAQVVAPESYTPQVGDTVVFDKTAQHPSGHIEMYDGRQWVSDFMQRSFSPYRDAGSTPPFTIYRLA